VSAWVDPTETDSGISSAKRNMNFIFRILMTSILIPPKTAIRPKGGQKNSQKGESC
jgi:hypothetical protein